MDFKKAIQLNKKSYKSFYQLAEIYESQEKYEIALALLKKAETIKNKHFWIYYLRGNIYYKSKLNKEAIKAYKRFLELSPDIFTDHKEYVKKQLKKLSMLIY